MKPTCFKLDFFFSLPWALQYIIDPGVCLCDCALVSECLAVGTEGVVFPVLRLLVSDAGGQVMR